MLVSVSQILHYRVRAIDGELGKVSNLYFDDTSWAVRYIVADTHKWLPGRKVLIAPVAAGDPDDDERVLPVALSKNQVRESPDVHTDLPVSRQAEIEILQYYGWTAYWQPPITEPLGGPVPFHRQPPLQPAELNERRDPHLRAAKEIIGYQVHATDGDFGEIVDFVLDSSEWRILYLVADTRRWLPGTTVPISPRDVVGIDWALGQVSVGLSKEEIKQTPPLEFRF